MAKLTNQLIIFTLWSTKWSKTGKISIPDYSGYLFLIVNDQQCWIDAYTKNCLKSVVWFTHTFLNRRWFTSFDLSVFNVYKSFGISECEVLEIKVTFDWTSYWWVGLRWCDSGLNSFSHRLSTWHGTVLELVAIVIILCPLTPFIYTCYKTVVKKGIQKTNIRKLNKIYSTSTCVSSVITFLKLL